MKNAIEQTCLKVLKIDLEKFLKILRVELEYLDSSVKLLMDAYQQTSSHESDLSEHVRQENIAVLKNETFGFKLFFTLLDAVDLNDYETLEELSDSLKVTFEKKLKEAGLARAAYLFAERKIEKVTRYILGSM